MSGPTRLARTAGRLLTGVVAGALLLTGCSGADDQSSRTDAGALAAARAYVDAIAAQDPGTADKMTDYDYQDEPYQPEGSTDITAALAQAADPITDPWVAPLGPGTDDGNYLFNVSYRIKDLTGGGTIALHRKAGADPSKISNWAVISPLAEEVDTFADAKSISAAQVGSVKITGYAATGYEKVWGYPGGYLLKPATPRKDVDPVWFAVGAVDLQPWNVEDDQPKLKSRSHL